MAVQELGHVVLYVRDVQQSAAFYRDVLGWQQKLPAQDPVPVQDRLPGQHRPTPLPIAMFSSGRTHHELLLIEVGDQAAPVPAGRRLGMYHFGLKVGNTDDELREMLAQLQQAGATVYGASDHGFTHSLYIADPDGNEVELYVDVPGVDWDDPMVLGAATRPLQL